MGYLNQTTLAYPTTNVFPGRIWEDTRDPTSSDYRNFSIGTTWVNFEASRAWIMVDRTATSGTWVQMASTGTGILTITGNSGGAVGPDGSNNINVVGTESITVVGTPVSNTLTVTPSGTIPTSFVEDSGSATPSSGVLNISGGTGIATSGSGNTVTISATAGIATVYNCDSGTATPSLNTLNVFGSGGTTTTGSGATITIQSSGSGLTWNDQTLIGPVTMVPNNAYVADNGSLVTFVLPATCAFGSEFLIAGKGGGGWTINLNSGQTIHYGVTDTTTGTGGSLSSTKKRDVVTLVCTTEDTEFTVLNSIGNLTVV